ncbi:MAG: hypothetical protein QNI84_07900, partial [Henriciella sp.]|nr:hypothetical protein [Henriciella sp.]
MSDPNFQIVFPNGAAAPPDVAGFAQYVTFLDTRLGALENAVSATSEDAQTTAQIKSDIEALQSAIQAMLDGSTSEAVPYELNADMRAVTPTELPAFASVYKDPVSDLNGSFVYPVGGTDWEDVDKWIKDRFAEIEDRIAFKTVPRHDVAMVEISGDGRRLQHIRPDGRHVHNHKPGSIKTEELEEGGKLAAVPAATLLDGSLWDFIAIGQDNKRIWGV